MEKTAKGESTWPQRVKAYGKPVAKGLLAGGIVALLLLTLSAAGMAAFHLTLEAAGWLARIAAALSGLAAGFFAAKVGKRRGLLLGGGAGILLGCCALAAGLCMTGPFDGIAGLTKLLLFGAAGMLGGVLGVGSGKSKHH